MIRIRSWRFAVLVGMSIALVAIGMIFAQLPALAAGGMLHPMRKALRAPAPRGCEEVTFQGAGVALQGWRCPARKARRGTLVYPHGIADNRGSAAGVVERFVERGFDVIAYDSRAHGEAWIDNAVGLPPTIGRTTALM